MRGFLFGLAATICATAVPAFMGLWSWDDFVGWWVFIILFFGTIVGFLRL